jgi:hypothetical protein
MNGLTIGSSTARQQVTRHQTGGRCSEDVAEE